MKLLFWSLLVLIFYTYLGYPLLLWLLSLLARRDVLKKPITPYVSVVISALNEEDRIGARLENLLAQRYPSGLLEIIIVSDGSTDRTGDIVAAYRENNVRLLSLPCRNGKALALNLGIAEARGEIILFADARQRFEPDVVAELVANFNDSTVGCVSGELKFVQNEDSFILVEMGTYWKYEKWIRKMESLSGSVVGATGAIYAIRKSCYRPLRAGTLIDDVLTPLNCVLQGYRTVFDESAVAYDTTSKGTSQEWTRKVRTLAGNWQVLSLNPALAFPISNPIWWRFTSHKLLRLIIPFALLGVFFGCLALKEPGYRAILTAQVMFYSVALLTWFTPHLKSNKIASLISFFVIMNVAALAGFWCWVTGRCSTAWQPAENKKRQNQEVSP